jgi:PAS domain S-box-containing protein
MRPPDPYAYLDEPVGTNVPGRLWLRERAFESAASGIVITDATRPDHPVIDVNPAFERITGHLRADVMGQNVRLLQCPATDPVTVAEIRAGMAAQRETNVTILNQRRDGTPFWNDLLIAPVFDPAGRLTHFVGLQTDITARKRAEIRTDFLARASDRFGVSLDFRAALAAAADLAVPPIADLFLVDLVGDQNRRERSAFRFDGLPSATVDALRSAWSVSSDDQHGVALATRTGQSQLVESVDSAGIPSLDRAGAELGDLAATCLLSYLTVPIVSRGRILGALTIATTSQSGRRLDRADLLLMEDFARRTALAIDNTMLFTEAQVAVRARDQFLSIAAHELRTPVSSIKGYAQLLLRAQRKGEIPADRLRRSLETIDSSTDRLSLLTSDLLDVSRIRLGHLPLRPSEFDIADKVRSVVQRHTDSSGGLHEFDVSVAPGIYLVQADTDRINQVLTNLFENATKYSPDDQHVAVALDVGDQEVRLTVRDHGIGLPPGGAASIFEPFERAANALKHELPGLGLGLYICRGIVERHGGRIWAESEGEGTGTSFFVTIPTLGHGPDLNADQAILRHIGY